MSLKYISAALMVLAASAAQPLPELRVEPTAGGSIFYIKNGSAQPLTAYLIELVDYPGSYYSLWQDDVSAPVAPGAEKRIQVANMTVGAVPDYVKLQAALYADGTSSGIPEKVTQLVERRRFILETTREMIRRLEKAQSAGAAKASVIADLRQWAASMQPQGRPSRNSQAAINQAAGRPLIADAAALLDGHPVEEVLAGLRAAEQALASSKPAL
ncbi:MAG TPA: hypothetical protein VE959_12200 [Bryobacteraceae bacterium]|nr:hypothetical protein [Bryobacteraceae bacterium]